MKEAFLEHNNERWFTLKQVAILTDKSEGHIKSKIAKGILKKYDSHGNILSNPIQSRGFFKASDIKEVFSLELDLSKLNKVVHNNRPYLEEDIQPKVIVRLDESNLFAELKKLEDKQFDVCIASISFKLSEIGEPFRFNERLSLNKKYLKLSFSWMDKVQNLLTNNGSFLIYHIPTWLPYYACYLADKMVFKYWISVHTFTLEKVGMFNPTSTGVLFMVKKNSGFIINTLREPHTRCKYCGEMLKDYGGKKHLMHQGGAALSDVWKTLLINDYRKNNSEDNYQISSLLLKRLINLTCNENSRLLLLSLKKEVKT